MRLKAFRYVALFFVFLSFGCGLHKTPVVQPLPDPYPDDAPKTAIAAGNQEIPEAAEENPQSAEKALIESVAIDARVVGLRPGPPVPARRSDGLH